MLSFLKPGEGPSRKRGRPKRGIAKIRQDTENLSSPTVHGSCQQSKLQMEVFSAVSHITVDCCLQFYLLSHNHCSFQ